MVSGCNLLCPNFALPWLCCRVPSLALNCCLLIKPALFTAYERVLLLLVIIYLFIFCVYAFLCWRRLVCMSFILLI